MTKALRIVVADDEPVVREYFCRILPLLGHEVVAIAADGQELIDRCREQHPDLIIADVRMPKMDGDEAIHTICHDRPTPFILVSAYSKPTILAEGVDSINWLYLSKPIKRNDLQMAINQVCGTTC